MAPPRTCPACGSQLASDAPDTPCPACLMKLGLRSWENHQSIQPTIDSPAGAKFDPPKPHELADQFPQFEMLDLIGHGGMGAVYKARQKSLDRVVALKIIKPEGAADNGFADRFAREAKALARLNHSNIVSVYDFGQSGGLFYLVMEFVDGANLRQLIESGSLTAEKAIEIVPKVCEALQFAHDEGVVHRDIKPENILVDARGRVKIADFGLAKLLTDGGRLDTLTGTHQVMGTPRYMAPEQMEGSHSVDHRADIYSLGVVFYEMLTGELPLGRFDPPSRCVTIDTQWDDVVLRALQKEPSRRYQHASEVKSDVERLSDLDHPPVRAAATIRTAEAATDPTDSTTPHYGLLILGAVMAFLGMALLGMSTAEGDSVFLWVGIGIALGGGGCLSSAFGEAAKLPAGAPVNTGMLMQGGVMFAVGIGLLMFSFSQDHGFWVGNPFVWVGIGLTIGGGGCCKAAWPDGGKRKSLDQPIEPALGGRPMPTAKKEPLARYSPPRVTGSLVLAWFTFAAAMAVVSSFTVHAANPVASWALWLAMGVLTPLVMCGAVVWLGERRRGSRYPAHPGEWMWTANAASALLWLVLQVPVFIMQLLQWSGAVQLGAAIPTASFAMLAAAGLLHTLLAAILVFVVPQGRWRLYLIAFTLGLLARVAAHGFLIAGVWNDSFQRSGIATIALAFSILPAIPLVLAAAADLFESKRYPWSHWLGVVLQASFHGLTLVYVLLPILSARDWL